MAKNFIGREAIYSTFFAYMSNRLLTPTGPFHTASRRRAPVATVQKENVPAFYLVEEGELYDRSVLLAPAKITLMAHIIVVGRYMDDPTLIPAIEINNLADAVEEAVNDVVLPTSQQILGGLVQEAWINSRQIINTGSVQQRFSEQDILVELIVTRVF